MISLLPSRRVLLAVGWAAAFCFGALAHQRIVNPNTGAPLFWSSPESVGIVISAAGSDDLPGPDDETALRHAIQSWSRAPGSIARLVEDDSEASQARTDWESDTLHLVWFDEDNSSDFFPTGSSTVAITPIWFFGDGRIADADVIYNGGGFRFTTSGELGRFDVEDVGAHELGHLLGLDHSPFAGSTMYPFVDSTVILHRSLSLDDIGGMRAAYPDGPFGRFTGRVLRGDDSPVFGAHVVAVDLIGRTRGAILTDESGEFELLGLDPGSYRIYAAPLDGPVNATNLTGGPAIEVDFEVTEYAGSFALPQSGEVPLGDLVVSPDVSVALGRSSDRLPLRGIRGVNSLYSLRGAGLVGGSSIVSSDPEISITQTSFFGSMVTFRALVPLDAPLGHVDLEVTTPTDERAVLPAAIELTPPNPEVAVISPASASVEGGSNLTITGNEFRPGARVVIGDQIYNDGEPGGCEVLDSTTITLTNAPTIPGVHDVVVIDETGVEGRLEAVLQTALEPNIETIFPAIGALAGGTRVRLSGEEFSAGMTVRIDGVQQDDMEFVSESLVEFTTSGATVPGLYDLEVEDGGGAIAQATFIYAIEADPVLEGIDPAQGSEQGGDLITLSGENFAVGSAVRFGADPVTGAGGVLAAQVSFIDAQTLVVETPAGQGLQSVLVTNTGGQSDLLEDGFQFGSSGMGGGCAGTAVDLSDPRAPWLGSFWVLIAVGFAMTRRIANRLPGSGEARA